MGFYQRVRYELGKIRSLIYARIYFINPQRKQDIIDRFQKLYYEDSTRTFGEATWLGTPIAQCPFDMWVMQEILFKLKPDVIIECGTSHGGSALFYASICDLIGKGKVLTIDVEVKPDRPRHERIIYLLGSSTSQQIIEAIKGMIQPSDKVMAILDSDHHKIHVLNELRIYSKLVTPNSWLIVEDTNINSPVIYPNFGDGPMEALSEFLLENHDFDVDRTKERFYMTFNPKGYLHKKPRSTVSERRLREIQVPPKLPQSNSRLQSTV